MRAYLIISQAVVFVTSVFGEGPYSATLVEDYILGALSSELVKLERDNKENEFVSISEFVCLGQ